MLYWSEVRRDWVGRRREAQVARKNRTGRSAGMIRVRFIFALIEKIRR